MGAAEYVNPPGRRDLSGPEAFEEIGVKLAIRKLEEPRSEPRGYEFIPMLSAIDLMMW